jgi:hypothetical protein
MNGFQVRIKHSAIKEDTVQERGGAKNGKHDGGNVLYESFRAEENKVQPSVGQRYEKGQEYFIFLMPFLGFEQ